MPHRHNQPVTDAVAPAAILDALARGDAEAGRGQGRALAQIVLRSREVQLAREILAGGEFMDRHIVELCGLLLEAGDVAARRRGVA